MSATTLNPLTDQVKYKNQLCGGLLQVFGWTVFYSTPIFMQKCQNKNKNKENGCSFWNKKNKKSAPNSKIEQSVSTSFCVFVFFLLSRSKIQAEKTIFLETPNGHMATTWCSETLKMFCPFAFWYNSLIVPKIVINLTFLTSVPKSF